MSRRQKPGGYVDQEELAQIDTDLATIESNGLRLLATWPTTSIDAVRVVAELIKIAQGSRATVRSMQHRRRQWNTKNQRGN